MHNLIYLTVSFNIKYITLLELLLASLRLNGNISSDTDILIITDQTFKDIMIERFKPLDLPLKYHVIEVNDMFQACSARLDIFDYPDIASYDKILYLDTDILIGASLSPVLALDIKPDCIYAMQEGKIHYKFWGGDFFKRTNVNSDTTAFCSGVMLFTNSHEIKDLFLKIKNHINQDIDKNITAVFYDQPYIVYQAIVANKYNNQVLNDYVKINPGELCTIAHFAGGPGLADDKHHKMVKYWERFKYNKSDIPILNIFNKPYQSQGLGLVTFYPDNSIKIASEQGTFEPIDTYKVNVTLGQHFYIICFNSSYDYCFMFKDGNVYYGQSLNKI